VKQSRAIAAVVTGVVALWTSWLHADAIMLSDLWVENVDIQTIADGRMAYITAAGGQVEVALERVQGVRLTAHPQYEQGVAAVEAGNYAQAVRLLSEVRNRSRQQWVDQLASRHLVKAHAGANQPLEAVQAWLPLAQQAHAWFVPPAPVDAVAAATPQQKNRIRDLLRPAVTRAPAGEVREAMQALLNAATSDAPPATAMPAPGTPATGATAAATQAAAESAILLPARMTDGPVVDLLRRGQFQEALDQVNRDLQSTGEMSRNLYLRGMAQLGLAELSGEAAHYKDAGLSFMRVLVHFPRSPWVGYARGELGYVHAVIGRPERARSLYATARIEIGEDEDPNYYHRISDLAGEL
jgi:tetratricopeptide (TPR) repeat protein